MSGLRAAGQRRYDAAKTTYYGDPPAIVVIRLNRLDRQSRFGVTSRRRYFISSQRLTRFYVRISDTRVRFLINSLVVLRWTDEKQNTGEQTETIFASLGLRLTVLDPHWSTGRMIDVRRGVVAACE